MVEIIFFVEKVREKWKSFMRGVEKRARVERKFEKIFLKKEARSRRGDFLNKN